LSPSYVYAVLDAPGPQGIEGAQGERIDSLPAGSVWLAVGDVAGPPAATPDALQAHDAAIRRLHAAASSLLPARFGQIAPDRETLVRRFAPASATLRETLALVAGCSQMTLRIFGLAPPPAPDAGPGSPGTQYLENRRRLASGAGFSPGIDALRDAVAPWLRAERAAWDADTGRLTFYHLVPGDHLAEYRAAIEPRRAAISQRCTLSGPWPPYAFARG
jgi:hypothetical protein